MFSLRFVVSLRERRYLIVGLNVVVSSTSIFVSLLSPPSLLTVPSLSLSPRTLQSVCVTASKFLAHLVNQLVLHEIVALEVLTLLLEDPTDDSVEVAVGFLKVSGDLYHSGRLIYYTDD